MTDTQTLLSNPSFSPIHDPKIQSLPSVTSNFESTFFSKGKSTDFGKVKSTPSINTDNTMPYVTRQHLHYS